MNYDLLKKATAAVLLGALAYVCVLMRPGWETPSDAIAARLLPPEMRTQAVYEEMAAARAYVYRATDNHALASPHLRTDDFAAKSRVEVDFKAKKNLLYYYNYARHYLLCGADIDESGVFNALSKLNPAKLRFNPHYASYGGGYFFPLAFTLKALDIAGVLRLVPDTRFYLANPGEMGKIYAAARLHGAVLGTIAVGLLALFVYSLTRSVFWAFFAAAITLLCPTIISVARLMKPHFAVMLFSIPAIVAVYKFLATDETKYFYAAMAFCGAAAGTIITNVVLCVMPLLAYLNLRRLARPADIVRGGLFMLAGFMVLNLYWVTGFKELMLEMEHVKGAVETGFDPFTLRYFAVFGVGTLPALLFVVLAPYVALRKDLHVFDKVLLQFLLCMMPVISTLPPRPGDVRWAIFAIPAFMIFLIRGANYVKPRWLAPALAVCCLLASGWRAWVHLGYYTQEDTTKLQAGLWLDTEAKGKSVGHISDLIPFTFPPLRMEDRRLIVYDSVEAVLHDKDAPEYFVAHNPNFTVRPKELMAKFYEMYRLEKKFEKAGPTIPESWWIIAANTPVYIYKRVKT